MSTDEKLPFKKEALLIIIGALLASVPVCITTSIQTDKQLNFQREQVFLERRITALKDYSISFNKLANDIIPRARKLRVLAAELKEMPLAPIDDLENKLILLITDLESYNQQFDIWQADVNTQIAVVNAVFDIQLKMFEFKESQPESLAKASFNDLKTNVIETEATIVQLNKNLIELLEIGQNNARLLTSHIQK